MFSFQNAWPIKHKTKSCVYLALFHIFIHFLDLIRSQLANFFNVAKCNLGKVNLELMLPVVSRGLHMICGGAPLEFTGQTTYSLAL